MKVEIPELKRCCLCIPLRYGLLAWGYIKLVLMLFTLGSAAFALVESLMRFRTHILDIMILSLFVLVMTLDVCLTIVFLIGGHRKLAKLLHIYYIYNIVVLCLYVLFFTGTTAIELYYMSRYMGYLSSGFLFMVQVRIIFGISLMGIQVYLTILIRSEVTKLRNSSKYRFTNPAADIESTLENVTEEQGIHYPKEESNENGTDSQFEGIINQTKETTQSFNYNKL